VEDGSSAGLIGLDEIEVEEVELGEGFPQLSDARVRPSGNDGEGLVSSSCPNSGNSKPQLTIRLSFAAG